MFATSGFFRLVRPSVLALSALLIGAPLAAQNKSPAPDTSGDAKTGKASYYGSEFFGKPMADGTPFEPESNFAASRTLPLGTKAEVTNLENGKTETVVIRDRGPYIDGRIIDLSPKTARKLDMLEQGVVEVEVTPLELPPQDEQVASSND